jgi:hypothetical protein
MVRNTAGLMRSARSRSEDATQRATAAILLMQAEEVGINFRSVAARAKVSTAWLYGTKSVRDKIVKIRNTSPVAAGENLQHRRGSRTNESWRLSGSAFGRWRKSIVS